ncbi:hypothetical protein JCM10450v2_001488 [Rhodotorula kratochvilovae]
MPWAYAVPLGVGLIAAVAVAVILIEVVPAVLDERSRARAERERRRRAARLVASARAVTPPHVMREGARASGVEVPEGGWKYAVRRRSARTRSAGGAGTGSDGDDEGDRYRLRPLAHESHHILGDASSVAASDYELGARGADSSDDDDVPLAKLSPTRGTFAVPDEGETPARSRASSGAGSAPGTAPFFSPPLSTSSRFEGSTTAAEAPTELRKKDAEEDPFTDDAAATSSTLFATSSSSSHESSPALSSASFFAPVSAPSHDSPASTGGWVLQSPTPSTTSLGTDDEGWARLSDEDDEWSKVRKPAGLGLAGMATH